MGNAVVSAHGGARHVALETQIKRFDRSYRRRLRKFTRTSSRHGDLLFTFPAIAFAMVSGRGAIDQRAEAARLVRDGASLARIADVLQLPSWMRRLPPEAFARPIGVPATGDAFGRKIGGRLPQLEEHAQAWLQALEVALEAGNEDFALWLAGERRAFAEPFVGEAPIRPLAIYAWFSRHSDVRGHRMLDKPWNRQMGFTTAVQHMCTWFERVMADLTRADQKRGPGRYSRRRRGAGYEMVPLRSAAELNEEGDIMDNCVGSYAGMVAARECLIFSVRRGSHRVATLEVRWHGGAPRIWQLEAARNCTAPQPIWDAVNRWLATQDGLMMPNAASVGLLAIDATRWKALWLPYVNAKGSKSLPLERPDQRVLAHLVDDIEQLVQRARR